MSDLFNIADGITKENDLLNALKNDSISNKVTEVSIPKTYAEFCSANAITADKIAYEKWLNVAENSTFSHSQMTPELKLALIEKLCSISKDSYILYYIDAVLNNIDVRIVIDDVHRCIPESLISRNCDEIKQTIYLASHGYTIGKAKDVSKWLMNAARYSYDKIMKIFIRNNVPILRLMELGLDDEIISHLSFDVSWNGWNDAYLPYIVSLKGCIADLQSIYDTIGDISFIPTDVTESQLKTYLAQI